MASRQLFAALFCLLTAVPAAAQDRLYTLSERNLAVLDGATLQQLGSVILIGHGNPLGVAVTGQGSRAYVGLGRSSEVFAVPGDPPSPGPQPRIAVVDLLALSVLRTIDVGGLPFSGIVASPSGDRVYVPRSGAIVVIRTSDDSVIQTISLSGAGGPIAVSPDGSRLYASATVAGTQGVVEIDTATFAVQPFLPDAVACFSDMAISGDGARLYMSGACPPGSGGVRAFDVATRTQFASNSTSAPSIALTPDGSKLVMGAGASFAGVIAPTLIVDAMTLTELGRVTPSGGFVGVDSSGTRAYTFGGWGTVGPNRFSVRATSVSLATYTLERETPAGGILSTGFAVAPVSPCAQFVVTPAHSAVTLDGGTGSFSAPVPAGCPWSVTATDPWLTITSATSGIGPATITYSVAPATGPRTAELRINGQVLPVYQTQPLVQIDAPAPGTHVVQGFNLAGWVGELAVAGPASTVLNNPLVTHVWAYPASGGAPTFIAQALATGSRPDVAAVFPGHRTGGFNVTVTGLPSGSYTFVVFLFSPYLNTFAAVQTITLTIDPRVFSVIDTLQPGAQVTVPFRLGGWALDASASTGTGVDVVNVYAYPDSGGAPIFAGSAFYGLPRADLVPFVGTRFRDSGFGLAVDGLAPGGYTMVAFAHSTVTGSFEPAVVHVTVTGAAEPLEIETLGIPPGGNPHAVFATGWAIDRRASSGPGVIAIQAWAYPASGAAPIFLGSAQMPFARAEIAAIYGSRYRDSGWTLGGTLPSGSYQIVFFALSAATGQFDNVRVRPLIVP